MPHIPELLAAVAAGQQPQAAEAKQQLRELVWHVGNNADRAPLAAALASELQAARTAAIKGLVCELLSLVGGSAEVSSLAELLNDESTREIARWTLDRIAAAEASAPLIAAAGSPDANFRIGGINSLARKGAGAATLLELAKSTDPEVRLAAAEALARIPSPEHDAAIAAAGGSDARGKKRTAIARVRLAENLVRAGKPDAAKAVYRAIAGGDAAAPQKKAAEAALAQLG